jgi:hypothetical protein
MKFRPRIDWLTWSSSAEVVEVSDYPAENPPNESQDSRTWRFLCELPWLLPEAHQLQTTSSFLHQRTTYKKAL